MSFQSDPSPAAPLASGAHAYLIGIGGCGMSGLARMFSARSVSVSGSDREPTHITRGLDSAGIPVGFDQASGRIPDRCDFVVASAAIKPDHPELLAAQERSIPVYTYAEALGLCMVGRTGLAVAGTHGKSTICAMLGWTLIHSGLDPTVIVGATCAQLGDNSGVPTGFRLGADSIPAGPRAGSPGLLIAEACEFNRSFHLLHPTIGCISAVEADHLDIYGSLDAVVQSFREFASLLPSASEGGYLLLAHDGAHRREVTAGLDCAVETIGFAPDADWHITYDTAERRVGLNRSGELVATWVNRVPGAHIALDSAIAGALAIHLGAEAKKVAEALGGFHGLDRRMQRLGEKVIAPEQPPVRVYDDYGHHPTEIDATLRALREGERPEDNGGRLICVFQPHQHSRTRFLLDEFAQSFSQADVVVVPHIYFVRDSEVEKTKVSSADLVDRLRQRGVHAMHIYPFEAIVDQLNVLCRPGDLLVVMGAGPVWKVAHGFLRSPAHAPVVTGATPPARLAAS